MIIKPQTIADEQIISNIANHEEQVGVHGIDITLESIEMIDENSCNELTLTSRTHAQRKKIIFVDNKTKLNIGTYDIVFNEKIDIPDGMCAVIYTRSTVNRGGNYITTGLYDAGYTGILGGVLHVKIPIVLEKGVRLAQIVFQKTQTGKTYDGIYNKTKTA